MVTPLSLYFHIPFCTRKCPYCHFYVIADRPEHKKLLLECLLIEWQMRLSQVAGHEIVSIYFGGGTPSLFGAKAIAALLEVISDQANVSSDCEVTLEANPEDVSTDLIAGYVQAGVNRVSIGVQSLVDASLQVLGRIHSAKRAIEAIEATFDAGIKNIAIDLMYELPDQTAKSFKKTLVQLDQLPITHLSLYNLTIEPHTPFSKKKLCLPDQEIGLAMLEDAKECFPKMGLKRYEISAFAKLGFESRHNVGYWTARPFFGLGPSAFSYYQGSRFRNVSHLHRYCRSLKGGKLPVDFSETLIYPQNVCELFVLELRLIRGVVLKRFDLPEETLKSIHCFVEEGFLILKQGRISLSEKGLLFYDTVAAEII